MKVTFYQRKPHQFHYSIEKIFEGVRVHLPPDIQYRISLCRFSSTGFWKRLYNTIEAYFRQGDINHITGDVHYLALLLNKRKTILTVHDCGFMQHTSPIARFILKWFWLKLPIWRSSVVTVISQATKQDIIRYTGCPDKKIKMIPDFVSEHFKPVPASFNEQCPTLLQIGTKANKNIGRLAAALEGLAVRLRIIGKPSPQDETKLKQHKVNYSWQANLSEEELIQEYINSDILTFASTLEGFGMPIVEAQSVGRPVVTSNISSMPEVAGDGACLVDPYDPSTIRNGILKVIQNPEYREKLVENGLKNIQRYQIEAIAGQYASLYRLL